MSSAVTHPRDQHKLRDWLRQSYCGYTTRIYIMKFILNCSISAWLTVLKSQLYFGNNRGQRLPKQRKETEEQRSSQRTKQASKWSEHQSRHLRQVHSTWVNQLDSLDSLDSLAATFACSSLAGRERSWSNAYTTEMCNANDLTVMWQL